MPSPHILLAVLLILALTFDFLNGFHDSANVVATMIASRAMTPRAALGIAAVSEFSGPLLFGVAVATTIGKEVAPPNALTIPVVFAALLAASLWNIITWYFGIPSSSSHALIGGIMGAVALGAGIEVIHWEGLTKVFIALFFSPLIGFVVGWILMRIIFFLARDATPKANLFFKGAQVPTALALALSHGANDSQKTMGIITMGLVILGYQKTFHVPLWVILASASAISLGTATGGWRIIHTLGAKFYRIRPVHGFASQAASAAVILSASLLGGPVSTTQVVSSSILGVGAAQRRSQVRWGVMADMLTAWLLTIPLSAALGAGLFWLLSLLPYFQG
ncbi:MAG TPA: inorganic phosphate transporter [Chloroflexi bacterium]|nr:inorganic phosphate transporter [Chloroflexota bacterium]